MAVALARMRQNPADPELLHDVAAAIDAAAGKDPDFRQAVEEFVRGRQRPPRVQLRVLGPDQTPEASGLQPAFGRTLRIALAMRGGVSLAVWIGGCVAELDILRRLRICIPDRADARDRPDLTAFYLSGTEGLAENPAAAHILRRATAYSTLLAETRYDRVEIDILAGASAGGLNCILYSVAQMVGAAPDEDILETWQRDGGLQELMRPPGLRKVNSILQGDEYFFPGILRALERIHASGRRHQALIPEHLTIDLSATILDSEVSRNPDVQEGRGSFHFEGRHAASAASGNGPVLENRIPVRNDFAGGSGPGAAGTGRAAALPPEVSADLARLAYAARSTSSFPGAFEPATIFSMEGPQTLQPSPGKPNMRHAFGSHRSSSDLPGEAVFHVVDGGVFDNIPIGRALTAARGRVSQRPAHRALLYLDPDSVGDSLPTSRSENLSRFLNAVGASALRLKRRESLDSEVKEYVDYVNALSLNLGRSEALAAVLSDRWSTEIAVDRRRAYVRYRASADVDLLTQVLTRPDEWQVASTVTDRRNFRALGSDELSGLDSRIIQKYRDISRQDEEGTAFRLLTSDAQALLDAAQCSFSWLRRMESESFPKELTDSIASFDALRTGIYGVINSAVILRDQAIWAVLEKSTDCAESVRHEKIMAAWLSAAETTQPSRMQCWAALQSHFEVLVRYSADLTDRAADAGSHPELREWTESPWPDPTRIALLSAPDCGFTIHDLAPCLAAAGIPPVVARIRYWRIGSDERPAHACDYSLLKDGERRGAVAFALKNPNLSPRDLRDLLNPDAASLSSRFKLAGNTMANFSGFLSRDWRENDWWWGRLDAAAGISRFLETVAVDQNPRIPELDGDQELFDGSTAEAPRGSRNRVTWLQDQLTDQWFGLQAAAPEDRRKARQSIRAGADSPSDLGASYRMMLMSRGLRVLWRARPDGNLPTALGSWLLHVLLVPLFAVLPAIVHPARLAFILGFGDASLWVLARPENAVFGAQPFLLYLGLVLPGLIFLALAFVALADGHRRWRPVLEVLSGDRLLATEYRGHQRSAARKAMAGPVAVILLLVPLGLAASQARQLMVVVCLVFMGILTVATRKWAMSVPAPVHGKHPALDWGLACTGLLLAVAVPLVTELLHWSAARDWQSLAVLAGSLLVLALVLTCDWLTAVGTLLTGLAASAGGILAAWGVWVLLATLRQSERTILCLFAAFVAWGLAVWWMPEITRMLRHRSDAVVTVPRPKGPSAEVSPPDVPGPVQRVPGLQ